MDFVRKLGYVLFALVLVFVFVYSSAGLIFSQIAHNSADQTLFLDSHVPNPLPDGTYVTSDMARGNWTGMNFNRMKQIGVNTFVDGTTGYAFNMYITKGVQDSDKDILKLDYNVESNPMWVRVFQDELVETSQNEYLGKLQLRLLPFIPFVVGFFHIGLAE